MSSEDPARIRARSARLRNQFTGLLLVLWLLLLLERFGAIGLRLVTQGANEAALGALAAQVLTTVPDVFYLMALAGVRRALDGFAAGRLYAPTVTDMLHRVGVLLAVGAMIGTFLVPTMQRVFGTGPGYWIALDVSGLVLGSLGLALTVIARVLRSAETLRTELEGIF